MLKILSMAAQKARPPRTSEERDIIKSLNDIRENIEYVYDRMNYSSDALITDSLTYELLALKSRHQFYLEKARELNLKSMYIKAEV